MESWFSSVRSEIGEHFESAGLGQLENLDNVVVARFRLFNGEGFRGHHGGVAAREQAELVRRELHCQIVAG
jgi:hypothetical protein